MSFDPNQYMATNKGASDMWNSNPQLQQYFGGNTANYATWHFQQTAQNGGQTSTTPAPTVAGASSVGANTTIVPGNPTANNQMNVVAAGGQLAANPQSFISGPLALATQVPKIDPFTAGTNINGADPKYGMANGPNASAAQGTAATASNVQGGKANTYEAALTEDKVKQAQMDAAKGTVNPNALVDANGIVIDTEKTAAGQNALGQALNQSAQQNISNIIDTSTLAGKLLAQTLGEGNYTDAKATLKGQLDILSAEFVDAEGNPKIPTWAAGTARAVSKIAAFGGMTGSAATAAMATAIMEASIPVAQADAQFFQTVTLQNLSNRQQSTINKASVLANLELANMDARMTAAVNNANSFMQMDLANLSNEQQARVINTQARVQSILEDAKSVNAQRLFTAQSQNEMDMFYDNLNASINQFNAAQTNAMTQFNVAEQNSVSKFNAQLENQRQEFYKNMQYNIDVSNAKWRQTVTLTESQMKFDAAATDVKNMVGLSVEQLNQIWDRSDAMLDYIWKSSENAEERKNNMAMAQLQSWTSTQNAQTNANANKDSVTGAVVGAVGGKLAEAAGNALSKALFG